MPTCAALRLLPTHLLPILVGLGLTAARLPAQTPPAPAAPMTHGVDLSTLDTSVLPCRDFYQYADGKWLAANPVPADRSTWGEMSEMAERNSAVLHSILDRAVTGPPAPARRGRPARARTLPRPRSARQLARVRPSLSLPRWGAEGGGGRDGQHLVARLQSHWVDTTKRGGAI